MSDLHTPWSIRPDHWKSSRVEIIDSEGFDICEASPFDGEWTPDEIARINVMAAAPELLEALKASTEILGLPPEDDDHGAIFNARRMSKEAVAKAEGRQ